MRRLAAYDWPGNIRELRNAVERAVVLSQDGQLSIEHMFRHLAPNKHGGPSSEPPIEDSKASLETLWSLPLTEAKQAFERAYIQQLLDTTGGNVSEASKRAGKYRADIYKLLEKYDLQAEQFRQ